MKYKMLAMLAGVVIVPLATAVSWPRTERPGGAVPVQMLGEGGTVGTGEGGSITGTGGMTGVGGSVTGAGGVEGEGGAGGAGGMSTGLFGTGYTGPSS
ncbi:MAG TPA: hypothetical protein VHL80_00100 [Polyangia bacterium]|nr:hypothetical protein [Polyangia bacterium]